MWDLKTKFNTIPKRNRLRYREHTDGCGGSGGYEKKRSARLRSPNSQLQKDPQGWDVQPGSTVNNTAMTPLTGDSWMYGDDRLQCIGIMNCHFVHLGLSVVGQFGKKGRIKKV